MLICTKLRVTDSCRDGWNVRICWSSHAQVFRDRWTVQISDGWNVRNCSLSHAQVFRDRWTVQVGGGWNVRNWSSIHVHVFRDRWTVQIGDGWNVRNWLIYCKVWVWILQNLRCLRCKSIKFVLVVKPTLMLLFWLFGLCLYVWLFGIYDS